MCTQTCQLCLPQQAQAPTCTYGMSGYSRCPSSQVDYQLNPFATTTADRQRNIRVITFALKGLPNTAPRDLTQDHCNLTTSPSQRAFCGRQHLTDSILFRCLGRTVNNRHTHVAAFDCLIIPHSLPTKSTCTHTWTWDQSLNTNLFGAMLLPPPQSQPRRPHHSTSDVPGMSWPTAMLLLGP